MKVWELHNKLLEGAIRTTPDGEADIGGLVLSERAYLLVVRDYRPAQLVELVRRHGPDRAADSLVEHFSDASSQTNGRYLARTRSRDGGPGIVRSDETESRREVAS